MWEASLKEMSARVVALEMENRLLRQKLDQYIRHYFGGQRNEGLDKNQLELLLQGLPNVIELPSLESPGQKLSGITSPITPGGGAQTKHLPQIPIKLRDEHSSR